MPQRGLVLISLGDEVGIESINDVIDRVLAASALETQVRTNIGLVH
jgi:hypothetical protein